MEGRTVLVAAFCVRKLKESTDDHSDRVKGGLSEVYIVRTVDGNAFNVKRGL